MNELILGIIVLVELESLIFSLVESKYHNVPFLIPWLVFHMAVLPIGALALVLWYLHL